MNPYESGAIIDMNAARKTVPTPVDADASIEQCALGVGDGTGSLFVHGSYEAIKRVQAIIYENERMRRTNAAAKAETAAAVAKERERAAMVCERIADDYNRSDCLMYPELMTDAGTGANDCAAAIRAGATERGE